VLTTRVSLPEARYPDRPAVAAFFGELLSRVRALPDVRTAGAASGLPLAVGSGDWGFDIEGRARVNGRRPGAADWFVVTPGYFESLGVPLRRGRLPADSDTSAAPNVVFVNETTARILFRDGEPLGKRIRFSQTTGGEQPWRTIAGVVGDVRHRGLDSPPRTEIYIPYEQFLHFSSGVQARSMSLVVKTKREPSSSVSGVRGALRALDPDVPAAQVRDMSAVVSASVADRRLNVVLMGVRGSTPRARCDRALRHDGLCRHAADARDGRANRHRRVARIGPVARIGAMRLVGAAWGRPVVSLSSPARSAPVVRRRPRDVTICNCPRRPHAARGGAC
jgi:hypothetical protein